MQGANINLRNGRGRRPIDLTSSEHIKGALKAAAAAAAAQPSAKQIISYCALYGTLNRAVAGTSAQFYILV